MSKVSTGCGEYNDSGCNNFVILVTFFKQCFYFSNKKKLRSLNFCQDDLKESLSIFNVVILPVATILL